MAFVSIEFFVFFAMVFVLYFAFPALRTQNILIVVSSYIFYGWWDWRFVPLLFGISVANYAAARVIVNSRTETTRNLALSVALGVSFLALGIFKYCDFFVLSFSAAARALGLDAHLSTLHVILPLGISFMTFQGVAYVVDVWRGTHAAEADFVKFLGFKAFFPQLVAGPIERASNLLDQFDRPRSLSAEKVRRATWLLIYGFATKIMVADTLAPIVDSVFVANQPFGWSVALGTIAFGIQIYGDFCGYSLIAKGAALLLGFELIWNFRFPYWAVSISDFWRRWHISLSNWLRDYLYIPLGGNRGGSLLTTRNLLFTMTLGGLWHGASWNFVLWGLLHGVALSAWRFLPLPTVPVSALGRLAGWAVTMTIVFVSWFLFRARSYDLLVGMPGALGNWSWAPVHSSTLTVILAVASPLALIEWVQLRRADDFFVLSLPTWACYAILSVLTFLCLTMSRHYQASFIYFQF